MIPVTRSEAEWAKLMSDLTAERDIIMERLRTSREMAQGIMRELREMSVLVAELVHAIRVATEQSGHKFEHDEIGDCAYVTCKAIVAARLQGFV